MRVLVNGTGNIGTTLINLLVRYQSNLDIDQIYACKHSIHPWNKIERDILEAMNVKLCTTSSNSKYLPLNTIINKIDYIFEATANGIGLQNLNNYKSIQTIKASAQGSEKGFGTLFMTGINDNIIFGKRFVNVVSCNTHAIASLLSTITGKKLDNLSHADMVIVRRSDDLANHERLVSAHVVSRHQDLKIGTHHAIDVVDMFKTINVPCNLYSSDITTPSQLMHTARFNITLKKPLSLDISDLIKSNSFLASTRKFDSNIVFDLGRRYGFQGRLFSHAIVLSENLITSSTNIKGWAFIPQEGNSILSTLHAFLLQMKFKKGNSILERIKQDLLKDEW